MATVVAMDRASARELLDTLAEETDQLRDPAALQFAGGTTEATRAAEDALSEQLRGVDQPRAGLTAALPGAVTDGIVEDYRQAVAEALDRVRRGRAPEQAPVEHRTAPAVASSGTPDRGTGEIGRAHV